MTTAVVILNWNGKKFLKKFLPLVIQHTSHIAEIVVADNNSQDDSVLMLREEFPEVRVIENEENGGFSKGYNQALAYIKADLYVLLNSDIEVTQNWLEPLAEHMEKNPDTAACQPKIKSYSQKDYFEYAGAAGGFIDKYGYPFCQGRIFNTLEKDTGQYNKETDIFWASGACMITRAEIFHKLGGLDDDFFAHMEEIDYCWRAKNQGYQIRYIPESTVYHVGGGTLPKNNPFKTFLNFRNNLTLLFKNQQVKAFNNVYRTRLILDFLAASQFLLTGKAKDALAVCKAHFHFLADKNKYAQKKIKPKMVSISGIYKRSIVKEYYLSQRQKFTALSKNAFSTDQE
ncbi:MAG: glycosyltransferase family 2 protein [Bacteroidales bacterium]